MKSWLSFEASCATAGLESSANALAAMMIFNDFMDLASEFPA
jgi:hypothetical protein